MSITWLSSKRFTQKSMYKFTLYMTSIIILTPPPLHTNIHSIVKLCRRGVSQTKREAFFKKMCFQIFLSGLRRMLMNRLPNYNHSTKHTPSWLQWQFTMQTYLLQKHSRASSRWTLPKARIRFAETSLQIALGRLLVDTLYGVKCHKAMYTFIYICQRSERTRLQILRSHDETITRLSRCLYEVSFEQKVPTV